MGLLLLEGSVKVYHTVEDVLRSAGGLFPSDTLSCEYDSGEGVLCGTDEGVYGLAEVFHAFKDLFGALCAFFVAAFGPRVDYGIEGGGGSANQSFSFLDTITSYVLKMMQTKMITKNIPNLQLP